MTIHDLRQAIAETKKAREEIASGKEGSKEEWLRAGERLIRISEEFLFELEEGMNDEARG